MGNLSSKISFIIILNTLSTGLLCLQLFFYKQPWKTQKDFLLFNSAFLFLSLVYIYSVGRFQMLSQIKILTKKIQFFFHNKDYPVSTSLPSNELGNLEATFDSVIQSYSAALKDHKQLEQAKTQFVSIASHELRTPLTSIKGSLNLVKNGYLGDIPPKALQTIKIAERESDRLISIVNTLLDLAKIESGELKINKQWTSLQSIILQTCQSLYSLIKQKNINIENIQITGLKVFIDAELIQQVLYNLLSNAIKYSPNNSNIIIQQKIIDNSQVEINIKDSGPGVPKEDRHKIFESFRQSIKPKDSLVKGSGLGLSIAKSIVAQHNGEIGIKDNDGQAGSVFFFKLPNIRQATKKVA
ncbi:MAG: HAMP domain-containing histidine kinase [Bdellovibrionaceae bacterium]|nr:HAMP domain-containing histidine kinase [Pseudobdellovibrionaceae bacterium]